MVRASTVGSHRGRTRAAADEGSTWADETNATASKALLHLSMELIQVVEIVTMLLTFTLIGTGLPVCYHMYKTGNTQNVPFPFFIMSMLVSSLGLFYGKLIQGNMVILINAVALMLWTSYASLYILVSKRKNKPIMQMTGVIVLALSHVWYLTSVIREHDKMMTLLGQFMFFWSTVQLLTPVLDIVEIVKRQSSRGESTVMLTGGTMCCFSWLLYGWLLKDFFIYGPNIPGICVNISKFIVIGMYQEDAKAKKQ